MEKQTSLVVRCLSIITLIISVISLIGKIVDASNSSRKMEQLFEDARTLRNINMNKERFWSIIEKSNDADKAKMGSLLSEELDMLSDEEIMAFAIYVAVYLEALDNTIWLKMACHVINGNVSDDTNLLFTFWVMSQGETVLLKALHDPDSLSELSEIPFGNAASAIFYAFVFDEDLISGSDLMEMVKIRAVNEITPTIQFKDGEIQSEHPHRFPFSRATRLILL